MEICRCRVVLWTLGSIVEAWRVLNGKAQIRLPPVRSEYALPHAVVGQTVCWIGRVVERIVLRSKHQCFYRSYVIARVLRKCGVPLVLNIGLRNLDASVPTRGHCWLTLNGHTFHEDLDVGFFYPFALGNAGSDIRYWFNTGDDHSFGISRQKSSFKELRQSSVNKRNEEHL